MKNENKTSKDEDFPVEKDKVKESAGPTNSMEVFVLGEQEDGEAVAMRHCIEASRLLSSPLPFSSALLCHLVENTSESQSDVITTLLLKGSLHTVARNPPLQFPSRLTCTLSRCQCVHYDTSLRSLCAKTATSDTHTHGAPKALFELLIGKDDAVVIRLFRAAHSAAGR